MRAGESHNKKRDEAKNSECISLVSGILKKQTRTHIRTPQAATKQIGVII